MCVCICLAPLSMGLLRLARVTSSPHKPRERERVLLNMTNQLEISYSLFPEGEFTAIVMK